MILLFAYQCNLRAILVNIQYESPVKTNQDLLSRGQNIYIALQMRTSYLGGTFPAGSTVARVLDRTNQSPGQGKYDVNTPKGLPDSVINDVKENGAVYIWSKEMLPYQYFIEKTLALKYLQIADENLILLTFTFASARFTQWARHMEQTGSQVRKERQS